VRVAYTLEQCWHRVPGATASDDVELVGVSARHRHLPPPPWTPPIETRSLPLPRTALYDSWLRFRTPRVERATGPVDVLHATTIIVPPRSAPLVVTIHDLAFLHEPAHFTSRGRRVFQRSLDLVRRDAATVMTMRRRYGLERRYLLFVGTLEPRKNLARLVAAVERLETDHILAVVGLEGWGRATPPPGDRVRLLGFVSDRDRDALYAGADAFVYPSLREGFGLPVAEAMAHGTPVVTSRGTATEEVAGGAAVLVDPTDVDNIAAGIVRALADSDQLIAAGYERADELTWERTAADTVAAYEEVVARC